MPLLKTKGLFVYFQEERAVRIYSDLRKSQKALSPLEEDILISNLGTVYLRLDDPVKAIDLPEDSASDPVVLGLAKVATGARVQRVLINFCGPRAQGNSLTSASPLQCEARSVHPESSSAP